MSKPAPLSLTQNTVSPPVSPVQVNCTFACDVWLVYFQALPSRFCSIARINPGSAMAVMPSSMCQSTLRSGSACCNSPATASASSLRFTGSWCMRARFRYVSDSRSVMSFPMRREPSWIRCRCLRPTSVSLPASSSSSTQAKPWMLRSGVRRSCETL
ncbi:hypothetical protein Y695_04510 [Hydrogenophaga sp. T4]|nr:hypothetical protein Y695_04510 [Hydrogenophaga sp. T4]